MFSIEVQEVPHMFVLPRDLVPAKDVRFRFELESRLFEKNHLQFKVVAGRIYRNAGTLHYEKNPDRRQTIREDHVLAEFKIPLEYLLRLERDGLPHLTGIPYRLLLEAGSPQAILDRLFWEILRKRIRVWLKEDNLLLLEFGPCVNIKPFYCDTSEFRNLFTILNPWKTRKNNPGRKMRSKKIRKKK